MASTDQGVTSPGRARIEARTLRAGPVVDPAADHVRGLLGLRRLRDGPRLHGPRLLRRALPLAVLLAVPGRLRRGRVRLRPAVRLVAAVRGADHPDLPAGLPDDLLLLPQGLLPGVLAEPARVRRRRAAPGLLRRDPIPADPAERAPLVLVRRGAGRPGADLRRGPGVPPDAGRVRRRRRGDQRRPHGPRHAADDPQRRLHLALHALVPLLPPHRRRPAAPLLQAPGPLQALDLGLAAQREPRQVGVVLAVLRRDRRLLRLPARHRHDPGR